MSPNDNKRIAEACGWHTVQQNPLYPNDKDRLAGFRAGDFSALCGIPNYTESLDSIREAVLAQDERFQNLFTSELDEMERINRTAVWKLSAADWCAAFLAVVASTTASFSVEGMGE